MPVLSLLTFDQSGQQQEARRSDGRSRTVNGNIGSARGIEIPYWNHIRTQQLLEFRRHLAGRIETEGFTG
ncbi:hypothetical protein D3C87_1567050 [compost metagenome]